MSLHIHPGNTPRRKKIRKRIAAIAALVLVVILAAAYITLGGLNHVAITQETLPGYIVAGTPYQGDAQDEALLELFNRAKQYHQTGTLAGTLTAVYYKADTINRNAMNAFVGAIVRDSSSRLPDAFEYRVIAAQPAIRATIQAHYLVAPSPGRVQEKMQAMAKAQRLQLQDVMIEKYVDEWNIVIEIPVKSRN